MTTITANEARHKLDQLIDETAESHIPVSITGKRHDAVMISAADWASIQQALNARSSSQNREFIARGLGSRDEAQRTGGYVDSDEVLGELDAMLADAQAKAKPAK